MLYLRSRFMAGSREKDVILLIDKRLVVQHNIKSRRISVRRRCHDSMTILFWQEPITNSKEVDTSHRGFVRYIFWHWTNL
jgi:hypothetical protein